jgi:pyridoxamine 5'-phosphate oxidase
MSSPTRREYEQELLDLAHLDLDPIRQFRAWFDAALMAGIDLPDAMTLATAAADGRPSARVVLLKSVDERGFTFFTNLDSRKGRELAVNPQAALVFFWAAQDRQVRVEGRVEPVSDTESDAYFQSRPRSARLGAWASPQSAVVPDRAAFEARIPALERQFPGDHVPRPPHWGGLRVVPETIEFWQGRPDRLHDRFRYRKQSDGWLIERLAP